MGMKDDSMNYSNTAGMEPLLLRPPEVARLLGVSRSRAYELIASGVLPSVRIGRSIRVPLAALRAWIASNINESAN